MRKKKKKKKEGGSEKGGGGGVKIHRFHLPWIRAWLILFNWMALCFRSFSLSSNKKISRKPFSG